MLETLDLSRALDAAEFQRGTAGGNQPVLGVFEADEGAAVAVKIQAVAAGLVEIDVGIIGFAQIAANECVVAAGAPVELVRAVQAEDLFAQGRAVDDVVAVRGHVGSLISFYGLGLNFGAVFVLAEGLWEPRVCLGPGGGRFSANVSLANERRVAGCR